MLISVVVAESKVNSLIESYSSAPIAAVDAKDEIFELLRSTKLSSADSWRQVMQSVPLSERGYIKIVQDTLHGFANKWKETREVRRKFAFLYNYRNGSCFLYDLEG